MIGTEPGLTQFLLCREYSGRWIWSVRGHLQAQTTDGAEGAIELPHFLVEVPLSLVKDETEVYRIWHRDNLHTNIRLLIGPTVRPRAKYGLSLRVLH